MKHNFKITLILLTMFIISQLIGIYVVSFYAPVKIIQGNVVEIQNPPELPFGLETPEIKENKDYSYAFVSILIAFMIAISLLLFLTKLNAAFFLKLWFFIVVVIALGIAFNVIFSQIGAFDSKINILGTNLNISWIIVLLISLPLAYIKIYKREFIVHNLTELIVYPGIAAIFVPILNVFTIILLLIIISIYDMWAVWHSGLMQKMAKYQINKLNVFSGFFIPYASEKVKLQLKKMKKSDLKKKKIKVNVAILGGGDVIFPIITAGVMLKTLGLGSALFVVIGATIGLGYLFFMAEKKKFYPAMPFISAGIFAGIGLSYLVF